MRRGWWVVVVGLACGPGHAGSGETTAQGTTGQVPSTDPTDGPADETSAGASTSGSSSGSSSDGTTEVFDPNDCGEFAMPFKISPANVVFVVDKSGSMQSLWDHDDDDPDDDGFTRDMTPATAKQPRWRSIHEGLALMVQTYDKALNSGLSLVPSTAATADHSAAACPVEALLDVPVEPMNAMSVIAAMPAADDVAFAGATPTTMGISAAVAGLQDAVAGQPRSIVLVTDGAANCQDGAADEAALLEMYDEQLPVAVADAFAQGISTHVLGVDIVDGISGDEQDSEPDGVNAYELLDAVAIAGGAPQSSGSKFHTVVNETLLAQGLERVAPRILDCRLVFAEPAAYSDYVRIYIDDEDWGRPWVEDCASEDGWLYTNEEKTAVQLCGDMCAAFGKAGELAVKYRCPVD